MQLQLTPFVRDLKWWAYVKVAMKNKQDYRDSFYETWLEVEDRLAEEGTLLGV